MKIESFLLCDCATDQQGKLTVLGAFDTIRSNKMPVLHPACSFVARIRFSKTEEGEHKIRINVIDEDGRAAGPDLEQNISIKVEEGSHSVVRNLILNVQDMRFEKFGEYGIDLAIDGRQEGSLPLKVQKVSNQR